MLHYRLDGGERNLIYPVPEFTEYTLVNEILNSLSNIYNSLDRYKNNIEYANFNTIFCRNRY